VQAQGTGGVARAQRRQRRKVDAFGGPCVAGAVVFLPRGAILQQVFDLGGDAPGAVLFEQDHAQRVAAMSTAVGKIGDHGAFEQRTRTPVGVEHRLPVEVEAQLGGQRGIHLVAVSPAPSLLHRQVPLGSPLPQGLAPVPKMDDRQTVGGLVPQNRQGAFGICHGWTLRGAAPPRGAFTPIRYDIRVGAL